MPYIKEERRELYDGLINSLAELAKHRSGLFIVEGDVNYIITRFLVRLFEEYEEKYSNYNAVMGVLECVKHELYRRLIVPYEKKKCRKEGDVYY